PALPSNLLPPTQNSPQPPTGFSNVPAAAFAFRSVIDALTTVALALVSLGVGIPLVGALVAAPTPFRLTRSMFSRHPFRNILSLELLAFVAPAIAIAAAAASATLVSHGSTLERAAIVLFVALLGIGVVAQFSAWIGATLDAFFSARWIWLVLLTF